MVIRHHRLASEVTASIAASGGAERVVLGPKGAWVVIGADGSARVRRGGHGLAAALERLGPAAVTHLALGPSGSWIAASPTAVEHHGIHPTVAAFLQRIDPGALDAVALGGEGAAVAVTAEALRYANLPRRLAQLLHNRLGRIRAEPVSAIVLGSHRSWLVTAGSRSWSAGEIEADLCSGVEAALAAGELVTAASAAGGAWWFRGTASPGTHSTTGADRLDAALDVDAHLARSLVPGAAVGAVVRGSYTVLAHGHARARHPVLPTTVFQAASLSKPVTAWLALTLADAGVLDLDHDVEELLPEPLPVHPLCTNPGPPVTVRRLLAHRAGIAGRDTTPNRAGTAFARGGGGSHRYRRRGRTTPVVPTTALLATARTRRNGAPPTWRTTTAGSRFSYSGAGYLLVQHAMERAAAAPFSEIARTLLFEPHGMGRSTFALDPPAAWDIANGHDSTGQTLAGGREVVPWSAAGGLYTTAGDLCRFLDLLLQPAGLGPQMAHGTLGLHASGARISHGGDNGGFRATLVGLPAQRRGVVVLTNGTGADGIRLRNEVAAAALDAFTGAP